MLKIQCKSGNHYWVEDDFTGTVCAYIGNSGLTGTFPIEDLLEIAEAHRKFFETKVEDSLHECEGVDGQSKEIHDKWGCSKCNPIQTEE